MDAFEGSSSLSRCGSGYLLSLFASWQISHRRLSSRGVVFCLLTTKVFLVLS